MIGIPNAFALGLMAAVLAWVPFVGSVIGCVIVVLVAATDFPSDPWVVYAAVALFLFVRLLDDFVFMPLTVGRSLHMHPLPTVVLIFVGGAVAGITGLILVLPLAGVIMVVAGTIGGIVNDPRLRARNSFANELARAADHRRPSRLALPVDARPRDARGLVVPAVDRLALRRASATSRRRDWRHGESPTSIAAPTPAPSARPSGRR